MVALAKYHGLCEACDHEATCNLKRSPRLEIIHCEQFSTQPVVNEEDHGGKNSAPLLAPRSADPA